MRIQSYRLYAYINIQEKTEKKKLAWSDAEHLAFTLDMIGCGTAAIYAYTT